MKLNEDIFERMMKSNKKALLSFHSHRRKARQYVFRFLNGFTEVEREFVLKEILHQQNRSIVKAIANKKNIAIPFLGSFQYRESLELIREIKKEVKQEFGVDDLRTVDEDTYRKINEQIQIRKKLTILPLYFKQHGNKGSSVNPDFLKK